VGNQDTLDLPSLFNDFFSIIIPTTSFHDGGLQNLMAIFIFLLLKVHPWGQE
jgi:hypothetical protein